MEFRRSRTASERDVHDLLLNCAGSRGRPRHSTPRCSFTIGCVGPLAFHAVESAVAREDDRLRTAPAIGSGTRQPRQLHLDRKFTSFRDTLVFVSESQNITLSIPRDLLKRAKRLAAERDTSVSALMTEALGRLTDEERRYSTAMKRALAAMKSARSLGTRGRRTWTRNELHER